MLAGTELDAIETQITDELGDWAAWLDENDAEGYLGEYGWPSRRDDGDRWDAAAETWLTLAEAYELPSSAWSAGRWWGDDPLTVYGSRDRAAIDESYPAARVVEGALDDPLDGVNVSGLEFGTHVDGFGSADPGVYGTDYTSEPAASWRYLADAGIRTVRLPFRWERVQPEPFADLDEGGVAELRDALRAADDAGVDVILDLHNFGAYRTGADTLLLGTEALPVDALADVWQRLVTALGDEPAVVGWGLMNEPNGLDADPAVGAEAWESASQAALDAIRDAGNDGLVLVAGYDWSSVARWRAAHPDGWITDPAGRFRYEGHHYWDIDESGTYPLDYDAQLAELGAQAG